MTDWRTKNDQELTAADIAAMRQAAQLVEKIRIPHEVYKRGWDPADELPMATNVNVLGTLRNDQPVAELIFYDPVADRRAVHISVPTALDLQLKLAGFLAVAARP